MSFFYLKFWYFGFKILRSKISIFHHFQPQKAISDPKIKFQTSNFKITNVKCETNVDHLCDHWTHSWHWRSHLSTIFRKSRWKKQKMIMRNRFEKIAKNDDNRCVLSGTFGNFFVSKTQSVVSQKSDSAIIPKMDQKFHKNETSFDLGHSRHFFPRMAKTIFSHFCNRLDRDKI